MDLNPNLQKNLYGFDNLFLDLKNLFYQNKLPNKILFSGQKGIGKCTLAYHLSNYILSINEIDPYNFEKKIINDTNKSFKLVSNNSHPNFYLINLKDEKKSIEIEQVRKMINYTNMSSFNDGYKIILIDNVENLNLNSVNALLKIIEEPNNKVLFFLIHDIQKKIFDTFRSRCIQFKLNLPNNFKEKIINSLTDDNFYSQLNPHFKTYYSTPGEYINFYYFCIDNNIDFVNTNIEDFLRIVLSNSLYKKNNYIKENLNYFLELFFIKKINHLSSKDKIYDLYNYFIKKINNVKKYNLDEESLFIELKAKCFNE